MIAGKLLVGGGDVGEFSINGKTSVMGIGQREYNTEIGLEMCTIQGGLVQGSSKRSGFRGIISVAVALWVNEVYWDAG